MTERACRANITLALSAMDLVTQLHYTMFMVDEEAVNRMLVCGQCPKSGIDPQEAKGVFREGIGKLIHKVVNYQKERGPKKERVKDPERDRLRRIEARIKQLKGR